MISFLFNWRQFRSSRLLIKFWISIFNDAYTFCWNFTRKKESAFYYLLRWWWEVRPRSQSSLEGGGAEWGWGGVSWPEGVGWRGWATSRDPTWQLTPPGWPLCWPEVVVPTRRAETGVPFWSGALSNNNNKKKRTHSIPRAMRAPAH